MTDEVTELRGILNAGHSRPTAYVLRCAAETHEPTVIPCFSPRVISMIRKPPSTIVDRAVTITLRRKRADEQVGRFRADRLAGDCRPLRRAWRRWALDHLDVLRDIDPDVPAELHDRAADNWRPLLSIADLVGGGWPGRARTVALQLSGVTDDEDDATIRLLEDIRSIFASAGNPQVLGSSAIVGRLLELDDRPWSEWSHGRPLSAAKMARLLSAYSIHPAGTVRIGAKTVKGYRRSSFADVWERYLPWASEPGPEASRCNERNVFEGKSSISETSRPRVGDGLKRVTDAANTSLADGVTISTRHSGADEYLGDEDARY